ncbi:MAG: glycosyltransferase family A protein, partial [Candidatus Binatia bacterium]
MDISVIICTYNRSTLFRETLDSFFQCNFDGSAYELILVDNGSTDETSAVAQEFVARHPAHVKYIFEKIPDLANARNIAIQAAEGKLIAFLDDDVYLDPDWLREVKNVFARQPEAMCMGGKSIPLFDDGRPDWISDDLMKIYGSTNSGESVKFLKYPEYPFGLNMAFR